MSENIRESFMRFACKKTNVHNITNKDSKAYYHGEKQEEFQRQQPVFSHRSPRKQFESVLSDNFHRSLSKVSYLNGVKNIMATVNRCVTEVNNSSHYDLKSYEKVIEIPEMRTIRKCIKSNSLFVFGEQYGGSFYLDYYTQETEGNLQIFYIVDRQAKSWYLVAPYPIYDGEGGIERIIYRCNCLFSLKTGVPCAHEIQAGVFTNSSLYDLFRAELKVPQRFKQQGRPKKTRRNTEK